MTIQAITNYVYEHPYVAGASIGTIVIGAFAPGLIAGVVTASIGAITVLPRLSKISIAAAAYTAIAKPYLDPYLAPYYIDPKEVYKAYPALALVVGGYLYFYGAAVLSSNIQYMWSHKLLSSIMLAVPAVAIATSSYLVGKDKSSKVIKECFEQTLAIDVVIDLCVEEDKASIFVPSLGFYSSCVIRKTAREYYLTDEPEDLLETFLVGFGSGMLGGAFRYSMMAFSNDKALQEIGVKAVIGSINNGLYGLSAAVNKDSSPIKNQYGETLEKIDAHMYFVVEPLDAVIGAVLKGSYDSLPENIFSNLAEASMAYLLDNFLLKPTEWLISEIITSLTTGGFSFDKAYIETTQAIFINQTPIEYKVVADSIDLVIGS